jgi:hypothetical protein
MARVDQPKNRNIRSGIVWGSLFILIVLTGAMVSPMPVSNWFDLLFEPGAYWPRSYWGGYQEFPLPFLVLFLNWIFYCAVFGSAFAVFRRLKA